jgi:hypothetical protein
MRALAGQIEEGLQFEEATLTDSRRQLIVSLQEGHARVKRRRYHSRDRQATSFVGKLLEQDDVDELRQAVRVLAQAVMVTADLPPRLPLMSFSSRATILAEAFWRIRFGYVTIDRVGDVTERASASFCGGFSTARMTRAARKGTLSAPHRDGRLSRVNNLRRNYS